MKPTNTTPLLIISILLLTILTPLTHQPVTAYHSDPLPSLEYDHNGNLIDDGTHTYTYDSNNRLIKITNKETDESNTYTYGPLGNRVSSTDVTNDITTHYVYQITDIIQERDDDGTDLLREYAPNLAMIDHTGQEDHPPEEPEVFYYLQDTLGSTVALAESTGNIVERYSYETYGTPFIFDAENNFLFNSAYGNTRLWTGQHYQPDTGLILFPKRTYLPGIGRFLQRDSWGYVDGLNLYEYGRSSPLVNIDPLGCVVVHIGGGVGAKGELTKGSEIKEFLEENYPDQEFFNYQNDNSSLQKAANKIREIVENNPDEPVIITGYSWGSTGAVRLARLLNNDKITVHLLATVDRIGMPGQGDGIVTYNVIRNDNFFQRDDWFWKGNPNYRPDYEETGENIGINNIRKDEWGNHLAFYDDGIAAAITSIDEVLSTPNFGEKPPILFFEFDPTAVLDFNILINDKIGVP